MSEVIGEVGFEGWREGLGGEWKARVGVKVGLGSCLRVVVRAKGRRNTKAMAEPWINVPIKKKVRLSECDLEDWQWKSKVEACYSRQMPNASRHGHVRACNIN